MTHTVALFVTCLVDLVRPDLGFDVVRVLEAAGCKVEVPLRQTCCGQPNHNGGDQAGAIAVARRNIDQFERYDFVVVPSGSCGGMLKHHYPRLLADDSVYDGRSQRFAEKVYELSQFLVDIVDFHPPGRAPRKVTYHDACAGLRELGIKSQPRTLLERAGIEIIESTQAETCCGFGGTFCVKYPDISGSMVKRKVDDLSAAGTTACVAGDLGCLLNIEGKLHREGASMTTHHFAELLLEEPVKKEVAN